ncbi:uncharacterized protein B0H18DRAFT_955357 [Fomitopsis serialis]|uniref:uncharacterized protein n=1 Tax=Fomitopsis serialis TaxID=139415 RepID=UPI00200765F7|nr:uncharacterized protein B0H18DRAFT_955357 [Neoantrodia serialis]KAH9924748.1 hypothetical protein B0H18DRAFT_955357 [Neoantrodia serialis]
MQNPWAGHPYPAEYWRGFRRHRRAPRLLWFLIGAGTATFWIKSHQAHEWKARHCWRDRIPQDAYPVPSGSGAQAYATGNTPGAEEQKRECGRRWGWSWSSKDGHRPSQSPSSVQETPAATVPGQAQAQAPHVLPAPMPTDRWDEERHRVQALGKQATDTISELSEATLDSVLATVQSLKVKLAEARTQREQHLQQMQTLKDEQYKMFEEWRKQHEKLQQEQQQQPAPKPRYPVDFTSA